MRPLARLRWQLTLSHLAAIAVTLVAMVAAVALIAGSWLARQQETAGAPARQAELVASAIGGLVVAGDQGELETVTRALARGRLRLSAGPTTFGPGTAHRGAWTGGAPLPDGATIGVVGADGRLLAGAGPDGAPANPAAPSIWQPLVAAALAGERDPRRLTVIRPGAEPAALGAAPVFDERGQTVAAVIVASPRPPLASRGSVWNGLLVFGAASVAVLASASLFALAASSLVGYLLARRLVARLERLGRAAQALAGGDLSGRVEEGPPDEVGQLARRFNHMADRLTAMVAELETARTRTEAALHAKRDLVAGVSHELRTPLALIRGHVESLLQNEADPQRRQAYLAIVQRESDHLSRLIDDLFALSTAEAGAPRLSLAPVHLVDVIEETVDGLRPIARRERQLSVVTATAPDLPPALADRQRVAQVLGNLLRNAVRHTPTGGLIAVRAERRGDRVAVTVEDTGEGIAPEHLPHIFERFYRGDTARDRAGGGAGLGLAIVRELVEAMGGTVTVASAPGEGSRFTFTLPLAPARPSAAMPASEVARVP